MKHAVSGCYQKHSTRKIKSFNTVRPLAGHFGPMLGEKKEVNIADLGSGPVCILGSFWPGVKINLFPSDILSDEYRALWEKSGESPLFPVEHQDMERLTYPDHFFDIVYCENAIDHTEDARSAIKEMIRVCKSGGWLYLDHAKNQRLLYGRRHYWNINTINADCVFWNEKERFMLSELAPLFKTVVTEENNPKVISILNL